MQTSSATVSRGKPPPTPLQTAIIEVAVQDLLYKYALRKLRHEQDAEDLVQSTLETALKRDAAGTGWTGAPPPVQMFLGSVMNGEVSNKWRTEKRRPRIAEAETADAPSETPNAEQVIVGHEDEQQEARVKTELRAYFAAKANGRVPLAMLDAAESGVRGGKDLADAIECSLEEINRGRKRIQHHMDRIAKRLADDEPS